MTVTYPVSIKNDRVFCIGVKMKNRDVYIFNMYMPCSDEHDEETLWVFNTRQELLAEYNKNMMLYLL